MNRLALITGAIARTDCACTTACPHWSSQERRILTLAEAVEQALLSAESVDLGEGQTCLVAGDPTPEIGETVIYHARTRGYALPAIITTTCQTIDPQGVRLGHVPSLSDAEPLTVHLHVLTPGEQVTYNEHTVPYDENGWPGTWCYRPDHRRHLSADTHDLTGQT